jgi:uncharacterized protein
MKKAVEYAEELEMQRRYLCHAAILVLLACTLSTPQVLFASAQGTIIDTTEGVSSQPQVTLNNETAGGRQSMKSAGAPYAKFHELRVTSIRPEGWLRQFLLKQRNGLTGHLDHTLEPFMYPSWNTFSPARFQEKDTEWFPYEQNAFWIEGMLRCGHLLGDAFLIGKARTFTNFVLEHPAGSGYLGPRHIGKMRWPHAVLFESLMLDYSADADVRIPSALQRHYLADAAPFDHERNIVNVEALCWTFGITGDARLLTLARKAWEESSATRWAPHFSLESLLSDQLPGYHGPAWAEVVKVPVIIYMYTGDERWLKAAMNGFRKLDRDHMLVDGVPSSNEGFDGRHPRAVHETCTIADLDLSMAYLLMATGSSEWADKIERATFNAGAGAVMKDFKAFQYFSGPNQVLATHNSSVGQAGESPRMSYRPAHDIQCCSGSVNRIFPGYASRLWLADRNGGLVAAMYGPSSVSYMTPSGVPVRVIEKTNYPFSDKIEIRTESAKPVRFTLSLRIPGWTKDASLVLNGRPLTVPLEPGSFARIERVFSPDDVLLLTLPMRLKMTRWPEGGVAIERGPLVYSLKIREDRKVLPDELGASPEFPAWDMMPASTWNYALATREESLDKDVRVMQQLSGDPWRDPPVALRVPAKLIDGWTLEKGILPLRRERGVFTPRLPQARDLKDVPVEEIVLVPYGCTLLRLTVFPDGSR